MKRNILPFIIVILLGTLFSCTKSQSPSPQSLGPTWNIYTVANGLPSNKINALVVDSSGNLWIGTAQGVSEFDGTSFTNYSLSNSIVSGLTVDKQGNIWDARNHALSEFNGKTWTVYNNNSLGEWGFSPPSFYSLAIDANGNKWVGANDGLYEFDGSRWTSYYRSDGLAGANVYSVAIDAQGNKWIGTYSGVSEFDGTNWTTYQANVAAYQANEKSTTLAGNDVNTILLDRQGNKWFGTFEGLSEFNGTQWKEYYNATSWLKAGSPVLSSAMAPNGNLWFGSNGWGVSVFNGTSWKTYTKVNQKSIGPVWSIAVDKQGNAWFGTSDGLLELKAEK